MTTPRPASLWPDPEHLGSTTDLYQLSMMAAYAATGKERQRATFEMFVRKLPQRRSYLVFAGLEQAITDVLGLSFSKEQVESLRTWPLFRGVDPGFFDRLPDFRFLGDIWAIPEGTVVFAGEPLIRVEAELAQAQWVESLLLASIGYPTLVATKASRICSAAAGRPVYDFGMRRGQGPQSGYLAARSAYVGGCEGTSHLEAARRLGIPCVGTMAHSWVQSFHTELEAFETFAEIFPGSATLLVDTFDTVAGIENAAKVEKPFQAIRIDSGDLDRLARRGRRILDEHGRNHVKIVVSGDLDETAIEALVEADAPVDAFGVGTEMITSRDAPSLSIVYKLVELDRVGKIKQSPGKQTYPGAKQVYRTLDERGRLAGDLVTKADEAASGIPLLVPVVQRGILVRPWPTLDSIRAESRRQVSALPTSLMEPGSDHGYPVDYSATLELERTKLLQPPATS